MKGRMIKNGKAFLVNASRGYKSAGELAQDIRRIMFFSVHQTWLAEDAGGRRRRRGLARRQRRDGQGVAHRASRQIEQGRNALATQASASYAGESRRRENSAINALAETHIRAEKTCFLQQQKWGAIAGASGILPQRWRLASAISFFFSASS